MSICLHCTSEIFHHPLPGGLMQGYHYGQGLRDRGIDFRMLALRTHEHLAVNETMNGISVERLLPPGHMNSTSLRGLHAQRHWLLQRALERCDRLPGVSHVLQPNMLSRPMWTTLLRARRRGIPIVHSIMIAPECPPPTSPFASIKHRISTMLSYGLVSKVVVLSQALGRAYQKLWHLRQDQLEVIGNGVDLQRFAPSANTNERARLRQRLDIPPEAKVVHFVGGVMPRKGVDLLIRAWNAVRAQVPEALLLIVGSNGPRDSHHSVALSAELRGYFDTLRALRENLNHPASVRFVGEVSDPVPYFQAADLFTFPSHREGLPNAMLEAMACGLPALTTPFVGLPAPGEELGHPGEHFLLLERDVDTWARTLVEMLSPAAAERRTQMGQAARSWVCATNDLERTLDLWAGLYHSLAAPSQTSPSHSHGSDLS